MSYGKTTLLKESYISVNDSMCLYGIAILMMVWHHFFGFPERFSGNIRYIGGNLEYTVELYLGYFGRLCVAMYAVISGYGMMAKSQKYTGSFIDNVKQVIKQIIHFFIRYWIVFFIFIGIGIGINVICFEPIEFLKNFIGKSCSYNNEWWYVKYYIKMLITFPLVQWLLKKVEKVNNEKWIIGISVLLLLIFNQIYNTSYTYYLCFWLGMILYQTGLYDKLSEIKLFTIKYLSCLVSIGLIIISILLKLLLSVSIDECIVLVFIFACLQLLKSLEKGKVIRRILTFLGRYSIYIWLIHTFFLYYYFQNVLLKLRYSILIYIVTIVICVVIGMLMDKIYWCVTRKGF